MTKIVFVDGPTAVGKDFFISKLTAQYQQEYPSDSVLIIRATDVIMNPVTESENRKYTAYNTDQTRQEMLFEGHIRLVKKLKALASLSYAPSLILVNRSFLSFLHYNLGEDKELIANYNDLYAREFTQHFDRVNTSLVRLTIEANTTQALQDTVCARVDSRADSKPVQKQWLRAIYQRYDQTHDSLINYYSHSTTTTSSEYTAFIREYLTKPSKVSS